MQAHQAELRKELGIVVVLAQITCIVTLEFFGTAVKAGSSHAALWLTAIALFFVPQALGVTYLNQLMPLEGGLYEWARLIFNDATGFLVAWNLWLYIVFLVAEYGFVLITYFAFALGPDAAWMASSKWLIVGASAALVGGLAWVSVLGLRIGKWITNAGGVVTIVALGVLILLPLFRPMPGTDPAYRRLPLVRPALTLLSLSVFTKMTFGALCGFEFVAIFWPSFHPVKSTSSVRYRRRSAYLVMFAIPLVGNRKLPIKPRIWLRVAAVSGFIVTLLFVVLSIFPVIDVPHPASYAWKTVAVVVGANVLGGVFFISSRQQHRMAE